MKMKIVLKELNDPFINIPTYTVRQNATLSTKREEIIFDYDWKDNSALSLKKALGHFIKEASDSIELLYKDNEKDQFIELNDVESITKLQSQTETINSTLIKTIEDEMLLYYKIVSYPIEIKINIYQQNIQKITQKLSMSCSILMMKHKIADKFPQDDTMSILNQKIFGISLKNRTKNLKIKMITNKEYDNKTKLINILKEYEDQRKLLFSFSDDISLKFLLVLNTKNAVKMGLNFNFNYFKKLSHISFEKSAPIYRECTDGLNMFSYCRNTQCSLYNEMFVRTLGYGLFDIIREILRTRCPHCCSSSLVETRNLGMINGKWDYKGILSSKKDNNFEGDGFTIINNRLYLFSEVKITDIFCKLNINITPYRSNDEQNLSQTKISNLSQKEEEYSLFDSVPLCLDNNYYKNKSKSSQLSKIDDIIKKVNTIDLSDKEKKIEGYPINIQPTQENRNNYCLKECLKSHSGTLCSIV